jgi:hypothetical protein
MPKDRNLLIVVADGEHVRFVRPAADNALHSETERDSPATHKQSADLGSDHSGASMHTGSSSHHALAPRHDPHSLAKMKFAHAIAHQRPDAGSASESCRNGRPCRVYHQFPAVVAGMVQTIPGSVATVAPGRTAMLRNTKEFSLTRWIAPQGCSMLLGRLK